MNCLTIFSICIIPYFTFTVNEKKGVMQNKYRIYKKVLDKPRSMM